MKTIAQQKYPILTFFQYLLMCTVLSILAWSATIGAAPVTGTKKVVVLRVYFQDYAATSRYSLAEVQSFYDNLDQLWQNTSYKNIDVVADVSTLFQLPDNRSQYIDDFSNGDLSNGGKFDKVLTDAIDNSPGTLDWTNVDAVNVIMAETDPTQFHRGQATKCNLHMGPGGPVKLVGCAIFSENPSNNDNQVWGRWAHEMGHTFQEGGPAHPSNYASEFELMDSNYPGQTGVFEKQDHVGFPGWLPGTKYQVIEPTDGGATASIWAEEYDPAGEPNVQAVKAKITDNFYYLISVRRRVLGDDLNGDFSPFGIPDEGVLIERVSEGSDPWVKVIGENKGPGCTDGTSCNRNRLWHEGEYFDGGTDGIFIEVLKKDDDDHYTVLVAYNEQYAFQPDVMLNPWTSPPGNTWETTDIWVDSPINGYDTYKYGKWNDGTGNLVPVGNGDNPTLGQVNRLYARVRNIGHSPATNVVVSWEITDPPGLGIAGATGWAGLGSVDKNVFPSLANIAPGAFVDVYIDWTPNIPSPPPPEDIASGLFPFHTCLRVKLNHVAGETVFGNQDGDREQENIFYFQAEPEDGGPSYADVIRLHNDDLVNKKNFYLNYKSDLPPDWVVDINGGNEALLLDPGEIREIPVIIKPGGTPPVGSVFGVDVEANSMRLLKNDLDPTGMDQHPEFKPLGGIRVESRVVRPVKLKCTGKRDPQTGEIMVQGSFFDVHDALDKYYSPDDPWRVMMTGVDTKGNFLPSPKLAMADADGRFQMLIADRAFAIDRVACMFGGTTEVASAGSGLFLPNDEDTDMDGTLDGVDNCSAVSNEDQRDTNHDGFGNVCDADLNNSNTPTNTVDFGLFRQAYGHKGNNLDADFNGDNIVNTVDFGMFKHMFGKLPGPSGLVPL